ncbi:MAG: hypothetical protein HY590_01335 [Candidatus Omnitrophica bacterium]|nr:hypothetical protein [Candidatus Omnitrophota bacterium]
MSLDAGGLHPVFEKMGAMFGGVADVCHAVIFMLSEDKTLRLAKILSEGRTA